MPPKRPQSARYMVCQSGRCSLIFFLILKKETTLAVKEDPVLCHWLIGSDKEATLVLQENGITDWCRLKLSRNKAEENSAHHLGRQWEVANFMQQGREEGAFQMPHIWTDTLMCSSAISPVKIFFSFTVFGLMPSDCSVECCHILLGEICLRVTSRTASKL